MLNNCCLFGILQVKYVSLRLFSINIIVSFNKKKLLFMEVVIKEEELKELISRSYGVALSHGFLDKPLSLGHHLMLVLTEVGEMVEADRKGLRADLVGFREGKLSPDDVMSCDDFVVRFNRYIKDTLDDEMADVAIRLFTLCGCSGIEPEVFDCRYEFRAMFDADTFCECCYTLSCILCHCEGMAIDSEDDCVPMSFVVGSALSFLFALGDRYGVDLLKQIRLKMLYNEKRPIRNGKLY